MENPKTPIKKVINKNNTLRMPWIYSGSLGGSSRSGCVFRLLLPRVCHPSPLSPARPIRGAFYGRAPFTNRFPCQPVPRLFLARSALVFALKFNRTTIFPRRTLLTSLSFFMRSSRRQKKVRRKFLSLSPSARRNGATKSALWGVKAKKRD